MNTIHNWYLKKGYSVSLGLPVKDDLAREIDTLLNEGWQYQKQFITADEFAVKAVDGEAAQHQAVLTASTGDVDRDREVVDVRGINKKLFDKNPIVAWGHDYTIPPIGKALWTKVENDKLKSLVQFANRPAAHPEAAEWFPDTIFALMQQGILKGVSIGFLASGPDTSPPSEKELRNNPAWAAAKTIIRKSMLLEISIVTLGSNPMALVESVSKGIITPTSQKLMGLDGLALSVDEPTWEWESTDFVQPVAEPAPAPEQKKIKTKLDVLREIAGGKHR